MMGLHGTHLQVVMQLYLVLPMDLVLHGMEFVGLYAVLEQMPLPIPMMEIHGILLLLVQELEQLFLRLDMQLHGMVLSLLHADLEIINWHIQPMVLHGQDLHQEMPHLQQKHVQLYGLVHDGWLVEMQITFLAIRPMALRGLVLHQEMRLQLDMDGVWL